MTRPPPRSPLFPYPPLSRSKPRRRWPAKHDTILVYVRTPGAHHFDADAVEREPYMAPGLVSAEKARGHVGLALDGVGVEVMRSEEHTSELQSQSNLVCRLLL